MDGAGDRALGVVIGDVLRCSGRIAAAAGLVDSAELHDRLAATLTDPDTQVPGVVQLLRPVVQTPMTITNLAARPLPTLGVVWAPSQEGYGEVRPRTIFNGGDPTGLVTDVVWESWGGATARGSGNSIDANVSLTVADAPRARAQVVAFDLGECNGELAYRAITWYFPEFGETFDPTSYINICTGEYVYPLGD